MKRGAAPCRLHHTRQVARVQGVGSAWARGREDPDVGGACLSPTLRAVSLLAGAGPLRPEDVLARCPQQVKAQNKDRTWIPQAVGLQKSWLWPMAAGRRVSVGDTPLTPGPMGKLALALPGGCGETLAQPQLERRPLSPMGCGCG